MNWIIFILIFASLVCRPGITAQASAKENIRKLKEKFMIALGLSSLFGMGWAIGLLASSDLPDAVRYPAEWIFTLATAFLGVYLFVLYVLRSQEARKLWKRWLLCQHRRKREVSFSSTLTRSRSRFRSISSTLTSWTGTLGREGKSGPRANHGDARPDDLSMVEKMTPEDWRSSEAFSIESSVFVPEGTKGETVKEEMRDGHSGRSTDADSAPLVMTEELTDKIDPTSSKFQDNSSLESFQAVSSQLASSPPDADEECYIVENKQAEEFDITAL